MLAIVPPIIRGKLDDSPLASTQSFQRSMQEMANSIELRDSRGDVPYREPGGYRGQVRTGSPDQPYAVPSPKASRRRAAVRRSRITAGLTVFAAIWGMAALVSGRSWCLVLFAISCCLLAAYWGLALIIPNLLPRSQMAKRREEPGRYPGSQVL